MGKQKTHKKQHFIPKSYLGAWIDPNHQQDQEPYIWIFPRDGGPGKRKAPKNAYTETDIYTIQVPGVANGRDLRLEHGLQTLEDSFVRTRRDFIYAGRTIPAVPRAKLLAFLSALQWRTPSARDHILSQWRGALEMMESLECSAKDWTPEQHASAAKFSRISRSTTRQPGMSIDDVRSLVEKPIQQTLTSHIKILTPMLARLRFSILRAHGNSAFITSDAPVVWFDPEGHKRPPMHQGPALMYKSIEITMPISPRHMAFITYADLPEYKDIDDYYVDELNRRTRAYSFESFVNCSPSTKLQWYELGTPPENAHE